MSDEKPEWKPDRAVTLGALAEVDTQQRNAPTCALCGQRAAELDRYGLCSKVTEDHKTWRADARADMKTGVRA